MQDARDARGLRYALVTVLVFILLFKLAGEDYLWGIAQWVKPQVPHATTYSRVWSGHMPNRCFA
jgi:hypothetical protein